MVLAEVPSSTAIDDTVVQVDWGIGGRVSVQVEIRTLSGEGSNRDTVVFDNTIDGLRERRQLSRRGENVAAGSNRGATVEALDAPVIAIGGESDTSVCPALVVGEGKSHLGDITGLKGGGRDRGREEGNDDSEVGLHVDGWLGWLREDGCF